jgi:hypothetical protein
MPVLDYEESTAAFPFNQEVEMKTSQEHGLASGIDDGDYVEFFRAGTRVKGVFQCVSCGELVVVRGALIACLSCGETIWERGAWTPFHRGDRP